ncbi:MAG: ABC transporter substrate-binding protein [Bacillota bacterium]|jgi:iron complex transport system substrate-binding protein
MKKSIVLLIMMLLILSFTLGCASNNQGENETEVGTEAKTITDSQGREVIIEEYPKKIISIAPAITEILFAIGLNEEIIGVSDYCDYPEDAQTKEKVGGFEDPNVEVIVAKNPDIVFASAGVQEELIKKLEELNIKVAVLDADNIEQVIENILITGKITGKEEAAEEIAIDMEERLADITAKVKERPQPKVFFEVWDDPLMSAGSGSFIHNIIVDAGGNNVASDNSERYYTFSMEKLLEANPDIYIINTHSHTPDDIINRNGYHVLSAVKNNKVFNIDDNLISRAGPRVIQGLEEMAKIIHPEIFE